MASSAIDKALAEAIGFRLTARRISLGLTQRGLAQLAGCSDAAICFIEQGKAVPGSEMLISLCRVLEMTPNEMLGWNEEVTINPRTPCPASR